MHHSLSLPKLLHAGGELQHAARIRRHDRLRTSAIHEIHFLAKQRHRHSGMHDVVDARASAAQIR